MLNKFNSFKLKVLVAEENKRMRYKIQKSKIKRFLHREFGDAIHASLRIITLQTVKNAPNANFHDIEEKYNKKLNSPHRKSNQRNKKLSQRLKFRLMKVSGDANSALLLTQLMTGKTAFKATARFVSKRISKYLTRLMLSKQLREKKWRRSD